MRINYPSFGKRKANLLPVPYDIGLLLKERDFEVNTTQRLLNSWRVTKMNGRSHGINNKIMAFIKSHYLKEQLI